MAVRTGLAVEGPQETDGVPERAGDIKAAYDKAASSLLDSVVGNWKDETLLIEDEMYGQKWKRGFTLKVLIDHEIHHRGQMTVLMRKAGLTIPGIYGPSKEEWKKFGMKEPEI
jgi:uncharacterized damage-inducible protein DinB